MNMIVKDIEKFIQLLKIEDKQWNIETIKQIANGIIFLKHLENGVNHTHYLNSLIQDSLTIIDSISQKSERYYHFILRSYIENFMRVLLSLENDDSTGVMKLFKESKKLLSEYPHVISLFENLEKQYNECCLFVHSNIQANTEITIYMKRIIDRNDFNDISKANESLAKFKDILNDSTKLLLICHSGIVDNSFYRKKDTLKMIITETDYIEFTKKLKNDLN